MQLVSRSISNRVGCSRVLDSISTLRQIVKHQYLATQSVRLYTPRNSANAYDEQQSFRRSFDDE
jgi:hypothetical protein